MISKKTVKYRQSYKKLFNKQKTYLQRLEVVRQFLSEAIMLVYDVSERKSIFAKDFTTKIQNEIAKDAEEFFCGREIQRDFSLSPEWYKSFMVQYLDYSNIGKTLYICVQYGWDYDALKTPQITENRSMERCIFGSNSKEVYYLPTISCGRFPVGTKWKSSTGKVWEVQIVDNDSMTVELENENGKILKRTFRDMMKGWEKV